jgi:hypothetical protein
MWDSRRRCYHFLLSTFGRSTTNEHPPGRRKSWLNVKFFIGRGAQELNVLQQNTFTGHTTRADQVGHALKVTYVYICMDIKIPIAQSFSPFLAQDGWQVCRPSWIWATSLCYVLLNKFVTLVGSGQRVCRPSCDEKGLKDWAYLKRAVNINSSYSTCIFLWSLVVYLQVGN